MADQRATGKLKPIVPTLICFGLSAAVLLVMVNAKALRGSQQSASPSRVAGTFDQEQALADLNKQIAGKETQPAEQVFKNIQQFKGVPARRVLGAMNAFSRALGVDCTHCHVVEHWDSEDKTTKQVAREMMRMSGSINSDYIKKINNLSPQASVSCSTCHRGSPHPDSRLPEPKKPQ